LFKIVNLGSWTIYGPKVITLILANFKLVKCCLLYYRQVNKYHQIKAGSLFYSPGKKLQVARKNCSVERDTLRYLTVKKKEQRGWSVLHVVIYIKYWLGQFLNTLWSIKLSLTHIELAAKQSRVDVKLWHINLVNDTNLQLK